VHFAYVSFQNCRQLDTKLHMFVSYFCVLLLIQINVHHFTSYDPNIFLFIAMSIVHWQGN